MQESKKDSLTASEVKSWGLNALLWLEIPLSIYAGAVLLVILQEGHLFRWNDLVPSMGTVGSLVTWALMQLRGLRDRYKAGTK